MAIKCKKCGDEMLPLHILANEVDFSLEENSVYLEVIYSCWECDNEVKMSLNGKNVNWEIMEES